MVTKVLVFGAEGLLGNAVVSLADASPDTAAVGLDREACDITDIGRIREVCAILRPKVLINCAAYTDVDGAESHEEEANRVNGIGAGNVAQVAKGNGIPMVHISTDYVFDGSARKPYAETARTCPVNAYGRSKVMGEQQVKEHAGKSLILRTGWLYGAGENSFVAKILRRARAGEDLRVVNDQVGCPTSASDLASVILELVRQRRTGIVHAVNGGHTTWYGFAGRILQLAGIDRSLEPLTSKELARPATRPAYCVLDTKKLEGWIEEGMPAWEDALTRFMAEEALSRSTD